MDNINNLPLQPEEPGLWQRFKEGDAGDKVHMTALAFAKTMGAAAQGISSAVQKIAVKPPVAKMISTAQTTHTLFKKAATQRISSAAQKIAAKPAVAKTHAFFTKGLIGQAIKATTALSIAEVVAAQLGSVVVASPARSLGVAAGSLAVGSIPVVVLSTTAIAAGLHVAANSASAAEQFQRFRQSSIVKGIATILGLSTLIALYFHYANDLEAIGQNLGGALFETLGSVVASIIAGYQVSQLSSGLSFEEYLQRNFQQLGAVAAFNFAFPPHPWMKLPWDLTVGMLAYNAVPIKDLVKTVHRLMTTRETDLASKIQNYLQPIQNASHAAAIAERDAAALRGEDLTSYDARVQETKSSSTVVRALFTNLDKLFRSSFESFVAYQKILTESDTVAASQARFIEAHRKAKRFEEILASTGIESTDEYIEALRTNPEVAANKRSFANQCLGRYTVESYRARTAFTEALASAIQEKLSFSGRFLKSVAGSRLNTLVLPQLDNLPEIRQLETTLWGFPITDSANADAAKELMHIHTEHFLAFSAASLASEVIGAVRREIFGQAPAQQAPLDRDTELKFMEGLLKLVVNHYDRTLPDSATVRMADNALPIIFTSLREGISAAFKEWRSQNQEPVFVELEETNDPDVRFTELPDDDWTGVVIDDGIGRSLSAEPLEEAEQVAIEIADDAVYFDAQEDEDFFDAPENPEEMTIDMSDFENVTPTEAAEAAQAQAAQPANSSRIGTLFRRLFKK